MSDPTHQNPEPKDPASTGPTSPADSTILSLCELDALALDALLAAKADGADLGPVPPGLTERSENIRQLLALLEHDSPQDPPTDLTHRTLQAIRAHQQRQRFSQQVQMLAEPKRSLGVNWHQLLTAAAVFIIGTSLLMPVMQRQKADSRRFVGAAHMGITGQAMASYAADNQGHMPRGNNARPGMVWWDVGQSPDQGARSNSAHLYRLVRNGYVQLADLSCPENAYANRTQLTSHHFDWSSPRAVSFSYQNQYTKRAIRLDEAGDMAIIADRNPIFKFDTRQQRIIFDQSTPMNAPSRAHRGTGQNVLAANGNVTWRVRPTIDPLGADHQDNIWAANGIDFYTGTETPTTPFDSFLVP